MFSVYSIRTDKKVFNKNTFVACSKNSAFSNFESVFIKSQSRYWSTFEIETKRVEVPVSRPYFWHGKVRGP